MPTLGRQGAVVWGRLRNTREVPNVAVCLIPFVLLLVACTAPHALAYVAAAGAWANGYRNGHAAPHGNAAASTSTCLDCYAYEDEQWVFVEHPVFPADFNGGLRF